MFSISARTSSRGRWRRSMIITCLTAIILVGGPVTFLVAAACGGLIVRMLSVSGATLSKRFSTTPKRNISQPRDQHLSNCSQNPESRWTKDYSSFGRQPRTWSTGAKRKRPTLGWSHGALRLPTSL